MKSQTVYPDEIRTLKVLPIRATANHAVIRELERTQSNEIDRTEQEKKTR